MLRLLLVGVCLSDIFRTLRERKVEGRPRWILVSAVAQLGRDLIREQVSPGIFSAPLVAQP